MISGYKIINQNDEKVLYIYLDFNYEFGGKKKESFFNSIKDLVKKINFKGKKILLVSSSIIIGTLLINPLKINDLKVSPSYNYVTKIVIHDFDKNNLTDYEINITDNTNEEKGNILENQSEDNVNTLENVNSEKSKDLSNNVSVKTNMAGTKSPETTAKSQTTNTSKITTKTDDTSKIKEENQSTETSEKTQMTETLVTIYRNNGSILKLELEEYLIGVVAGEMPASFNLEALKAQAIVARTYALKSIQNKKKLTDTVSTQVYKDNDQLKAIWGSEYNKYYGKIKNAVNETKGKVILYNGGYIDAVYHSTSNGKTENSINVWGNDIPYLKSVDSSWDKNVKSYESTAKFSIDEFYNILSLNIEDPLTFEVIHNETGRVRNITINNKTYSGTEFRSLLKLRSTDFKIDIVGDYINVTTYGYGHGVGMSQYGANEMAKEGYNYIQILKHYYSGVVIK